MRAEKKREENPHEDKIARLTPPPPEDLFVPVMQIPMAAEKKVTLGAAGGRDVWWFERSHRMMITGLDTIQMLSKNCKENWEFLSVRLSARV